MNYFELISGLKRNRMHIFSLRDIENLFSSEKLKTIKNNFNRWVKAGRLARIKRGLYEFIEPGSDSAVSDFYVANRLYFPSYISLETALSFYGLIPEVAAQVTSVTTLATRKFKNRHGEFYFRSCLKRAFIGYKLMVYEGRKVYIADIEKALADFIYFSVRSAYPLNFKEERFDKAALKRLNWAKLFKYARLFNRKAFITAKELKGWAGC